MLLLDFYQLTAAEQLNGPQPSAEYYVYQGDVLTFGIDWTGWLAQGWLAGQSVVANYVVRPSAPNGYEYVCATAGQTGSSEPSWPASGSAVVTDGAVTWACQATSVASLTTTVKSAVWTPPVGITVASPNVTNQVTSATLNTTAAVAGTDYVVKIVTTFADGEIKNGEIRLKVR